MDATLQIGRSFLLKVGFFVAVFLTEGFFTGVDEGFFALVVVFALGLPGAVFSGA